MAEVFYLLSSEVALRWLEKHIYILQPLEYFFEVTQMCLERSGIDEDVVHINEA